MDSAQILIALLVGIWLVGGFVAAVLMKRAGQDFRLWLLLGLLTGPFAALLARPTPAKRRGQPSVHSAYRSGDCDVLAGIDGSPDSVAAVQSAVRMLGERITSLTLARVLDYDSAGSYTGMAAQSEACKGLSTASGQIAFDPVDIELVYGPPAQALTDYANDHGFELIVVGARGRGMTRALFGSVAREIVERSELPVLVGPATDPTRPSRLRSRERVK